MNVFTSAPTKALSEYITKYIHFTFNTKQLASLKQTILPFNLSAFIFFEGVFQIDKHKNINYQMSHSGDKGKSYYMGVNTSPYTYHFKDNEEISTLLVVFQPSGLYEIVRMNASEITDSVPEFSWLFGKDVRILEEKLTETKSVDQKVSILDNFFLKKLSNRYNNSIQILEACKKMKQTEGFIKMKDLAYHTNMSISKMERHFTEKIGVSPKMFARIQRFHKSLALINNMGSKSLTEIAYDCGYFDQNHFIKEFKQFAYNTPSTSTLDEYYFFNMLILFSRYYTSPNSKF